jgi:hypothetical protein
MNPRGMCRLLVIVLTMGTLPAFSQGPPQQPNTRPAPGGQQGPGAQQGRPPTGGNPPPGTSNPGGRPPGNTNPGNRPPSRPVTKPSPGPRPPSNQKPGPRPPGNRPPQWGRPPQNRPGYNFRPNDSAYLRHYYRNRLVGINRARRPIFRMGGFFPFADIQYLSPLPPAIYGYLPPPPPGYQMGYFDGYVVVYDPLTYFIANVIDLLQ